jgi:acyl carrier protein
VPQVAAKPQAADGRVEVQLHDDGVSVRRSKETTGSAPRPETQRDFRSTASRLSQNGEGRSRFQRVGSGAIETDRAAEQIEEWLLQWLVARLGMDPKDVARDRPFAEFGVDSLTAVELSQELEDEFGVPLPAVVAWNYPTPAALARYLAEQTTGAGEATTPPPTVTASNGARLPPAPNEAELAALLAEIENLSDDEAAKLLADEERHA